jgi:hypothetical protein
MCNAAFRYCLLAACPERGAITWGSARKSPVVRRTPYFPMLTEDNVRQGFLEDAGEAVREGNSNRASTRPRSRYIDEHNGRAQGGNVLENVIRTSYAVDVNQRMTASQHLTRPKPVSSFRLSLSDAAQALLQKLSDRIGISRGACLELAIRQLASAHGVKPAQRRVA